MKSIRIFLASAFLGAALSASSLVAAPADTATPDRVTADRQGEGRSDLKLTQAIRRALMKDKSLSIYAHNVTIVSRSGAVTLSGTVKSEDERRSVVAAAEQAAGGQDKVTDRLTVKQ
jgi:osmotically-inducible protein OsmY